MRSDATHRAAVLGAGSWGTALAIHLGSIGHDVTLWGRDAALLDEMARRRANPTYLPDLTFPATVRPLAALDEALDGARHVIVAVPSHGLRAVVRAGRAAHSAPAPCSSARPRASRPTRCSGCPKSSPRKPRGRHPVVVLSGPSFAAEVARQLPTALVAASSDAAGRAIGAGRVPRPVVPAVRIGRRRRRRDRRGAEEHHRDCRRRRRVAEPRSQRAVGAHHARPGGDLAAGVRDGRAARDARRTERPGRSRADVHGHAQPQSARRASNSAAAVRSTRFSPGMRMVAEGVRTTTAALALGERYRRRAADRGADGRSARRPPDAARSGRRPDAAAAARRARRRSRNRMASFFDRIRAGLAKTAQQIRERLGEATGAAPGGGSRRDHVDRVGRPSTSRRSRRSKTRCSPPTSGCRRPSASSTAVKPIAHGIARAIASSVSCCGILTDVAARAGDRRRRRTSSWSSA